MIEDNNRPPYRIFRLLHQVREVGEAVGDGEEVAGRRLAEKLQGLFVAVGRLVSILPLRPEDRAQVIERHGEQLAVGMELAEHVQGVAEILSALAYSPVLQ